MSKIYLINVGANTSDSSRARSPIFRNGTFQFVPFSKKEKGCNGYYRYPKAARPFIRNMSNRNTRCDPDWPGLTYGDYCKNPRASSLAKVVEDDILLFWALLWVNVGSTWSDFTGKRRWCLIGALRVREIRRPGQRPQEAKGSRAVRAKRNVHFSDGKLKAHNYVFIGCTKHSMLFPKAVDLQVASRTGLLCRTISSAKGLRLTPGTKPKWYTSMRASRAIWDLDTDAQRKQAVIARDAIRRQTGYNLLRGL